MNKVCPKCGQEKELSGFYRNRSKRDGYASWCKICVRVAEQDGQRREYHRRYQREYAAKIAAGIIAQDIPPAKICSGCQEEKPISMYSRNRTARDGHQGYCKDCESAYQKSAAGRESTKRYYTSEHGRRRIARRIRRHPERRKAVKAVHSAKVAGELAEPAMLACADCGQQAREYHHESYEQERWLDVIPLCCKCHKARHVRASDTCQVPIRNSSETLI